MQIGAPAPFAVEQPALLREVLEDLLHEERVPFCFTIDRLDERGRWRLTREGAKHRLNACLRKRL